MAIQIFGTKKCNETKKALRFFRERRIDVHFIDLSQKNISKGELKNISQKIPLEDLINKNCREYEKMNLKYIQHDIEDILLENSLLIKTPVIRKDKNAILGFDQSKIKDLIS